MKVQNSSININIQQKNHQKDDPINVNFKSAAGINFIGNFMQFFENQGFWASFLLQDTIGMTFPRVYTGYTRDKEVTGHYNLQEGKEVLLRESITGPLMMAVAPLAFIVASKAGKTTNVNSQLIKRFGKNLEEMLSKPDFNKDLLKNKEQFKETYLKKNVEDIIKETLGEKHANEESINYVYEQLKNIDNPPANIKWHKVKKYKAECLGKISEFFNNNRYENFDNLSSLGKVTLSVKGFENKEYTSNKAFEALTKYSEDVISKNKNLADFDTEKAQNITNSLVAKRVITNIATIAATLVALFNVPKIYATNSIAPGARTAMELKAKKDAQKNNNLADTNTLDANNIQENSESKEVSFKGKDNKSILSRIGKFLSKNIGDRISGNYEYDGNNFTNPLMTALSVFGLILPRALTAYRRAHIDEHDRRDHSELYEVIIRDLISSLSIIYAVPLLTRGFLYCYEKTKGFVLLDKNQKGNMFKELVNPMSKTSVLSLEQLKSIYGNINSYDKLLNFCSYIEKNGGDLQKILLKSPDAKLWFNDKTFKLESLKKQSKKEKNDKIISFIKSLKGDNRGLSTLSLDEQVKKVMDYTSKEAINKNKILSYARGLNSIPAAITMVIISPVLLGIIIPKITYAHSRHYHEKREIEGIELTKKKQQALAKTQS